jgi:cullin 1
LARIPTGLEPLRKKFEEHVKKAGLAAVAKLVGEGVAAAAADIVSDVFDCCITWTKAH